MKKISKKTMIIAGTVMLAAVVAVGGELLYNHKKIDKTYDSYMKKAKACEKIVENYNYTYDAEDDNAKAAREDDLAKIEEFKKQIKIKDMSKKQVKEFLDYYNSLKKNNKQCKNDTKAQYDAVVAEKTSHTDDGYYSDDFNTSYNEYDSNYQKYFKKNQYYKAYQEVLKMKTLVFDYVNAKNEAEKKAATEKVVKTTDTSSGVDWVTNLKTASETDQLVVVAASGTYATISLHNKDNGVWTQVFSTNGRIGRNGLGKTHDWDYKTPVGKYRFTQAFGNKPDPGCTIGYTQVDDSYYYVDDSNSQYYNKLVTTHDTPITWSSAEHISAIGAVYNYVLNTSYNSACTPGVGSAIFFHCMANRPTLGCVSMPESNMITLMRNLRSDCIIIIDSKNGVYNY